LELWYQFIGIDLKFGLCMDYYSYIEKYVKLGLTFPIPRTLT